MRLSRLPLEAHVQFLSVLARSQHTSALPWRTPWRQKPSLALTRWSRVGRAQQTSITRVTPLIAGFARSGRTPTVPYHLTFKKSLKKIDLWKLSKRMTFEKNMEIKKAYRFKKNHKNEKSSNFLKTNHVNWKKIMNFFFKNHEFEKCSSILKNS